MIGTETPLTAAIGDVTTAASSAISDRMHIGATKYDPNAWRGESVSRHVRRAIRHAVTALEIRDGDRDADGENHLAAAVCRMAMALHIMEANR